MNKKGSFIILGVIELFCILSIYVVGGKLGPWVWSTCVFVIAPIASVALIVQIIIGLISLCKKKKIRWYMPYLVITLIMAYPITILFGCSLLTYPTHENQSKCIKVINPVEDAILLGGKHYKTHAVWPSECFAYDIVKVPYDVNSNELHDYGIYLADVKCPVSGRVIEVKDSEQDILPNTEDFISSLGNYIFIEIEETKTYLILAHLEKGSVTVSKGDYVTQGMYIAKVGNSGTTSEPHLHMQHQSNNPVGMKFAICAEGLPMEVMNN